MTTSPSLSARLARLTGRERRVLAWGAVASTLILVAMLVLLPLGERWRGREAIIAARADRLARLEALVASEEGLRRSADALGQTRARRDRTLLEGGTAALAGSALQSLVRGYGEQSRVTLQRLDPVRVADGPEAGAVRRDGGGEDGVPDLDAVALSVSARGDIYGLVDLLYYLQNGEKLLVVDQLRVNAPAGLTAGGFLGWTLRVQGFFDPAGRAQ